MQVLDEWAAKWGVSAAAVADLGAMYQAAAGDGGASGGTGEAYVQSAVRLEAPKYGVLLMRNNVGALRDERGVPVRYGLLNDSKQLNERIKSADLIGIRKLLITPAHVGQVVGQFTARECKHEGWKWRGDKHERAQAEFLNLVNAWGGDARFSCGPGSFV